MSKWLSKKLIFRIIILARSLWTAVIAYLRIWEHQSISYSWGPALLMQLQPWSSSVNSISIMMLVPGPIWLFWLYEANSSPNSSADWLSNTIKMKAFGLCCNNQGDYYTAGLAPPVGLTFLQHSLTPRPIWVSACHGKVKLTRWTLRQLVALSEDHAGTALPSAVCLA